MAGTKTRSTTAARTAQTEGGQNPNRPPANATATAPAAAPNPAQTGGGGGGNGGEGGGGGGGGGRPPPGGNPPPMELPPAPPQAAFSLTPGEAHTGVLNYSHKPHWYHWSGAVKKLEEELYDCTPDGFYQFIKSMKERAKSYGWTAANGVLRVPMTNQQGAEVINVLEDYGRISLARLTEFERTYINSPTRRAQDDRMLYECIMNSLSVDGKAKLNIHRISHLYLQDCAYSKYWLGNHTSIQMPHQA